MPQTIRFDERVAIVTGAGGGLGRSHALALAQRGALVLVNDLGGSVQGQGGDQAAAQQVVNEITAAGGNALANFDNIATPQGAQALVDAAIKAFGRVDVLINNAGILRDKSLVKMDPTDIEAVIRVHLMGSALCSRAVWPVFQERQYGRIVMTTSAAGLYGNFGQSNYAAAKMGLVGLMNALKDEGARYGIRVNTIAPVRPASTAAKSWRPVRAILRACKWWRPWGCGHPRGRPRPNLSPSNGQRSMTCHKPAHLPMPRKPW